MIELRPLRSMYQLPQPPVFQIVWASRSWWYLNKWFRQMLFVLTNPSEAFWEIKRVGDWGSVVTLQQGLTSLDTNGSPGTRAFVTGVQVTLSADHYGYPAGTSVMIGYAEAGAKAAAIAQKPPSNHNRRSKAPPRQTNRKKKHKTAPPPVAPEKPSYDHPLNSVAKEIARAVPDFQGLGHLVGFVLRKRP